MSSVVLKKHLSTHLHGYRISYEAVVFKREYYRHTHLFILKDKWATFCLNTVGFSNRFETFNKF